MILIVSKSKVSALNFIMFYMKVTQLRLTVNPWTVAHQAPLSMEVSRQEYWSGHSLLQGSFLTQRLNPGLLHCRQILYPLSHQASSIMFYSKIKIIIANPPKRVP